MSSPRRKVAAVVACVTSALVLGLAPSALANTYTVTRTDDPTPGGCHKTNCSLREAVIAANTHSGPDTIMLQGGKTYNLTIATGTAEDNANYGDLDILDTVTIAHTGSKRATINAHHIDRVVNFPPSTGGKATFSGLVIKGGLADFGGGIFVQHGSLKLVDSVVTKNRTNFGDGGGINVSVGESAKVIRSSITGNHADDEGGGVLSGGQVVILDSTVSGNSSVISGGGVTNFNTLTIRNDTVANNSTVENGGGVSSFGTTSVNDVTIARNKADSGNGAGYMGGGIFVGSGTFTISNSLIALNTLGSGAGASGKDCSGAFTSAGNNMRTSNDSGCTGFMKSKGDFVNAKPKIGPLANNGGLTETIALLTGSPAINKASPKTSEKRDQRGHKRDTNRPDIGAFEAPG